MSKRYVELVYAVKAWGLVFMERSRAENLADLHSALKARTWGEFRCLAGKAMFQEVVSILEENGAWNLGTYYEEHRCEDGFTLDSIVERFKKLPVGERIPESDDEFSKDQISGFCERSWPAGDQQKTLYWAPDSIKEEFGTIEPTIHNGNCLCLDPNREEEIVAAFEQSGYRSSRDEKLVSSACGCCQSLGGGNK